MGRTQVTTYQTFIWKVGADQTGVMSKQFQWQFETCSLKMMPTQNPFVFFVILFIQNSIAKEI